MNANKRGYRVVFLSTLIFSIYFETVSFFYFQTKEISKILLKDFRVVVSLKKDANLDDIMNKISALKGITGKKYVKSEENLKKIEEEDKDLYLSIKSMALNPIPDIIELEIDPLFLGNISYIVDDISKINGVMDIRYKPDEIVAIMHILFYSKFLFLIITSTIVIVGMTLILTILHSGISNFFASLFESVKWSFDGMLGSLGGILFIYIIIYPIRYLSPLWSWPSFYWHIITLLSGGLMGWILYQWKRN